MRQFLKITSFFAIGLCVFGLFGRFFALADSVAIFHPFYWFYAAFGSFFMPTRVKEAARILLILTAGPFLTMIDRSEEIDDPRLTLYQHNLLFTNTAPDLMMVSQQIQPDVMTLQEIKKAKPKLEALKDYPFRKICNFAAVGDVGVISRFPFLETGCAPGPMGGYAWARISDRFDHEVTIVSVHLHWPFPYGQRQQLDEILPEIQKLPKPIILAGDLNQVPWSYTVKAISRSTQSPALRGLRFTLVRPPLFLPIDHVFGEGTYKVTKLDRYGSDHNALFVKFGQ